MMIFHTPYALKESGKSASEIRPVKMLQAFKEIGYEVELISGNGSERRKRLKVLKAKIKSGEKFNFMYSESSTMPMFLTERHHMPFYIDVEWSLFQSCKNADIPIGYFYRDIHWKFNHFQKGTSWLKKTVSTLFHHLELKFIGRFVSTVFLPTLQMASEVKPYICDVKFSALPPGIDSISLPDFVKISDKIKLIYVGGIVPPLYDIGMLLNAMKKLPSMTLSLVCREKEFELVKKMYSISDNINILHLNKNEVSKEYNKSHISIILGGNDPYSSFGMPVKLFEAIEYIKPIIISSSLKAASYFVEKNNIGHVIKDEFELISILEKIQNGKIDLETQHKNLERIREASLWTTRARQVAIDLMNNKPD